jgi:N-acetylglutamate synthase-like GNAT family acetyltransferase
LLGREATADYFRFATVDLPIGETNAVMHALAVEESWQGRGIGSELLRLRLAVVRDAPAVDAALGNAWLRPHTGDVSVLFEKHGFERYETVDGSFRQSEGSRDCPDCGPDGCDCSTAVYAKTFDDESSETDRET